jgi:hypothetical protein
MNGAMLIESLILRTLLANNYNLQPQLAHRQYLIITLNYWAFTISDGALRMLVVLHFYQLGFGAFAIASLFLFYELFGVVTNLLGGWLGSRIGLNKTMQMGLFIQLLALSMLLVPDDYLTLIWVMAAQALSGIAKDLNKMSAKASIKLLVKEQTGQLFRWVSYLTGSKNSLKCLGFFIGAGLLHISSFKITILCLLSLLLMSFLISLLMLNIELGKANIKVKFKQLFSKSTAINHLSFARFMLFGARDVWFVVALPVFFQQQFGWSFWQVGAFMASWIIGYGIVQASTPKLLTTTGSSSFAPTGKDLSFWCLMLTISLAAIIAAFVISETQLSQSAHASVLVIGLLLFGAIFAINSAIHSYLIVHYAQHDSVSVDVGFYYMANAAGRLLGTLLSGAIYQVAGLTFCLITSLLMLIASYWQAQKL